MNIATKIGHMLNNSLRKRGVRLTLFVMVLVLMLGYLFVYRPARSLYAEGQRTLQQARQLKAAVKDQDLTRIQAINQELASSLIRLEENLEAFRYLGYIPYLKLYYQDGQHLVRAGQLGSEGAATILTSLEPFAEILGLQGKKSRAVTTQEKISQLVQIMPQITPAVEEAQVKIQLALVELNHLHPEIYPEKIAGHDAKSTLRELKEQIPQLQNSLDDLEPILEEVPQLLGVESAQNYLLLFQNNMEVRPTGGFITAYALVQFDQGNFTTITSDNIYHLDPKISLHSPPQPIVWHLKQTGWWMRDTNFSPDFKESMEIFKQYYQTTGAPPINGIIALDTTVVEEALKLSGPVEIPGYNVDPGNFWNLPDTCYQGGTAFTAENAVCRLELYAERVFSDLSRRKDVIGELMDELVNWALQEAQPKDWPELLKMAQTQLNEKHILLYLENSNAQELAEKHNWAGRIKDPSPETDYLHLNQANLAGLKSDMYMERKINHAVKINPEGVPTATVTITFHNTGAYDGWLNSTARNYLRLYVPQGSELLSWEGGEYASPRVFQDLDKTVFDNFLLTPPLSKSTLVFRYRLPFKINSAEEYRLLLQKQAGIPAVEYELSVDGQAQKFNLETDRQIDLASP